MQCCKTFTSLLLWGLLALVLAKLADACSCMPSHYQSLYCSADAVIKGTIKSKSYIYGRAAITNNEVYSSSADSVSDVIPRDPLYVVYSVALQHIYKGKEEFVGMTTVSMSSAASGSMCGISDLQEGETYVITGYVWDGELNIGLCSSWVEPFSSLTNFQKRGLKRLYGKTCGDCEICISWYGDACEPSQGCMESFESQCSMKNRACVRNSSGACTWKKSKYLKLC